MIKMQSEFLIVQLIQIGQLLYKGFEIKNKETIDIFLYFSACSTEFLQHEEIQCLFFVDGGPTNSLQTAAFI